MNRLNEAKTRIALALALVVVTAFGLVSPAWAQGGVYGSTIPAGQVVEGDVILSGDSVAIDGAVVGDVVAIGNTVTVNGNVDGSLVAIGQTVTLNGEVGGSLYVAAERLRLDPSAVVGNSSYAAGASLVLDSGSQIGRDLYAIGLGAQFDGDIGRQVKAIIGPIEVIGTFLNAVGLNPRSPRSSAPPVEAPESSQGSEQTSLNREPGYQELSWVTYVAGTGTSMAPRVERPDAQVVDAAGVGEWLLERLRRFIVLFLIGLLALWLIPVQGVRVADELRARPLLAAGHGLVGLITGLVGASLLAALILAIVAGLQYITLWRLALLFGGAGLFLLGFAFVVFLLLVFYGSKVVVSYVVGLLILERPAPQVLERKIVPLLLGLAIYVLVSAIPFIGWAVALIFTLLGLGSIWLVYRDQLQPTPEESPVPEPA